MSKSYIKNICKFALQLAVKYIIWKIYVYLWLIRIWTTIHSHLSARKFNLKINESFRRKKKQGFFFILVASFPSPSYKDSSGRLAIMTVLWNKCLRWHPFFFIFQKPQLNTRQWRKLFLYLLLYYSLFQNSVSSITLRGRTFAKEREGRRGREGIKVTWVTIEKSNCE